MLTNLFSNRKKEMERIQLKISFLTISIEDSTNKEEIEELKEERNQWYQKLRNLTGIYN